MGGDDQQLRCVLICRPCDIGLSQAGLPEVVVQAVSACPPALAPLLYGQVILTGGCCNLPGFAQRFEKELRQLVPDDFEVVVVAPQVGGIVVKSTPEPESVAEAPAFCSCAAKPAAYEQRCCKPSPVCIFRRATFATCMWVCVAPHLACCHSSLYRTRS